jgi:hypothetical protein
MKNEETMNATAYVQLHTLETPMNGALRESRGMMAEFDGIAEVCFESEEAFIAGMSSPEGQELGAALLEDEGNFIDHSKSSAFLVREHEFPPVDSRA